MFPVCQEFVPGCGCRPGTRPYRARDYERLPAHHEAIVYSAMITLMACRLARGDAEAVS